MLLSLLLVGAAAAQMPPALPNRDSYAIRKIDPSAPCRFESEYRKIKSVKSDPRVAYLELEALAVPDKDERIGFEARCKQIAEQTEDGITVFDKPRGYLHLIFGSPVIATTLAYFAPGVMLYVSREDDEWRTFAFSWRGERWVDVTRDYLHLGKDDLLILPQYGRTMRVLTRDGDGFRHKQWLTWDGRQFKPTDGKQWRCPDGFRYFEPPQRQVYCR